MKPLKPIFLCGLAIVLFSSCAKIFYSPDALPLAQNHKIIAIVPPTVSIAARRNVDPEAIKEQQKTESVNFQKEMYSWMLKRKMQGKIVQDIQELETTNAKLMKAGYPRNPLSTAELCNVLGVDGVITSNFALAKPMSEGAAVALGVLVGFWGSTNEVNISLSISDCYNKKLIWNFDHTFSGGLGTSPAACVDGLMRMASQKMPYIIQ